MTREQLLKMKMETLYSHITSVDRWYDQDKRRDRREWEEQARKIRVYTCPLSMGFEDVWWCVDKTLDCERILDQYDVEMEIHPSDYTKDHADILLRLMKKYLP